MRKGSDTLIFTCNIEDSDFYQLKIKHIDGYVTVVYCIEVSISISTLIVFLEKRCAMEL